MRVLLVDDDDLVCEALGRRLRSRGLEVDVATGVSEARRFLREKHYTVVISDQQMQDGRGHDLLAQVALTQPRAQRALVSALYEPSGVAVHWDRFFAKPNEMDALMTWTIAGAKRDVNKTDS